MRVLAIRRERLALQNSLHKIIMRLENLTFRMELLESAVSGEVLSSESPADPSVAPDSAGQYETGSRRDSFAGGIVGEPQTLPPRRTAENGRRGEAEEARQRGTQRASAKGHEVHVDLRPAAR